MLAGALVGLSYDHYGQKYLATTLPTQQDTRMKS